MGSHKAPPGSSLGRRTLDTARRNETVKVVRVTGRSRLVRRLAALGIVPGATLTVLKSSNPSIVAMGGARFAIGAAAARSVEIEAV